MANLVAPTASWVSKPLIRSPLLLPARGVVQSDPDGGWMIVTGGGPADAFLVADPDGGVMVDDGVASGLSIAIQSGVAMVY